MSVMSHSRGRCHSANYRAEAQILSSDVDCSNSISVILPLALFLCAGEDTPTWRRLALVLTDWTGLGGVAFVLQFYHHAKSLGLVGDFVSNAPSRPLMDLLIGFSANINMLPEISNVAYDHGLHALLIQRGNKSRCLLVFDILDLVLDFPQLLLFGFDQLLSSTGPFLASYRFSCSAFPSICSGIAFSLAGTAR